MRIFRFALVWCLFAFSVPAHALADPYLITVNFTTFTLTLTDDTGAHIAQYPVALPKPTENPRLPARGYVERIENPASWRPTTRSIAYFWSHKRIRLPSYVPPGHPLNAMGAAKILVKYTTSGVKPTARIHGTNEPKSIGTRASGGCIRMHNHDILALIDHIHGHETHVLYKK